MSVADKGVVSGRLRAKHGETRRWRVSVGSARFQVDWNQHLREGGYYLVNADGKYGAALVIGDTSTSEHEEL